MNILAIDLASKRYSDFGFAFLEAGGRQPSFPDADEFGLADPPDVNTFAQAIDAYSHSKDVTVLLLDGPQGWRHPLSPIDHMRLAERVLNTPLKTGVPGEVKPKTYAGYAQFCVDLFSRLSFEYGWRLVTEDWPKSKSARWVVEVFPSSAWKLLGLKPLPAKSRTRKADRELAVEKLKDKTGYALPENLTHDQLQAAVVLPVGEAMSARKPDQLLMSGYDPIVGEDGVVHEGWILNPRIS